MRALASCVGTTLQVWRLRGSLWGVPCCRVWALGTQSEVLAACGLSSAGAQAWLPQGGGQGSPPDPGIKPTSPESAGRFLTAGPPGKFSMYNF